ncbi:MAG: histidine kinase [Betaproteobacteria bacterium]
MYFALIASMLKVAMPDLGGYARNLLFSECIGLAILAWGTFLRRRTIVRELNFLAAMGLTITTAVVLGYSMGRPLALALLGEPLRVFDFGQPRVMPYMGTVLMAILAMGFMTMHDQSTKEAAARSQAQLRLLRAQLEPHMLFNTLATLRSLVDDEPMQAQAMIDQMIAYLRSSLAASRVEATTLLAEFEQLRAYLEIMSLRMGPRLSYRLDLPDTLRGQAIPSMLLQPLVENALKHGLEPQPGPGRVTVEARRTDAVLEVCISDSGVGLGRHFADVDASGRSPMSASSSYGLLHVRERLKAVYGARGTLNLASNGARGAIATVRIPL